MAWTRGVQLDANQAIPSKTTALTSRFHGMHGNIGLARWGSEPDGITLVVLTFPQPPSFATG